MVAAHLSTLEKEFMKSPGVIRTQLRYFICKKPNYNLEMIVVCLG